MAVGEAQISDSMMLARRLRWNRAVNERPGPQPVVVLLGPVGSGKTHTLESIEQDCGTAVVHALFDFKRDHPASTVEALTRIAYRFSRKWTARRRARFRRFTLGLIAVQAPLDHISFDDDRERLHARIEEFARNPRMHSIADEIRGLADTAKEADILTPPLAEAIKETLPWLVRWAGRKPLGKAKRWWRDDIPEVEGMPLLDTLISLNEKVRERPAEMTAWLTAAFIADVRDNYITMSKPDPVSPCACDNPDKIHHYHNWVLLLDNIDQDSGARFVADLHNARDRHLRRHPGEHDPVVVIATSGRWNTDWGHEWRPPWKSEPNLPDRLRTVVRCREAGYQHWTGESGPERQSPKHYPVLLEPLGIDETARILGIQEASATCVLAQRATGGLPAAVTAVAALLGDREFSPGVRDVLRPSDPVAPEADQWRARLDDLRLAQRLPDVSIEEFVTAAPFATAPWLVPAEATSLIPHPQVGRILTELRTALWVTAHARGRGTADPAELHPWVARTLVSALAARRECPDRPSYDDQFKALLGDPETQSDMARKAYCQLALGQLSDVVDAFESDFDQGPHQDWIDRLELVARAPDNKPLDRDRATLFQDLIDMDVANRPGGRSTVGNVVTRLVAALWLASDPFVMPDPAQRDHIANGFGELPRLSRRADVDALYTAARRAAEAQL